MSEFKGTPGKWILMEGEYCHYTSIRNEDNTRTLFVSRVNNQTINNANFKLISKAPEMLEILQEFVSDFDNGLIEDFQIARDRFEKLIKEATDL